MKKHLLLSLLMLTTALSTTWAQPSLSGCRHITDVSQIEEGHYYYIVSDRTKFNGTENQIKAMSSYQNYTTWQWSHDFVFWGTLQMSNDGFVWKAEKAGNQWAFQNAENSKYLGHKNTGETDMKFSDTAVGFTLTNLGSGQFSFTNSEYTEPLNVHNYPSFDERSVCATEPYSDARATDAAEFGYPGRWHLYEWTGDYLLEDGKNYYIVNDAKPYRFNNKNGKLKALSTLQNNSIHQREWGEKYVYWGDFIPSNDGYLWTAEKTGDKWAFKNTKNGKYIGNEREPEFSDTPVYFTLHDYNPNANRFSIIPDGDTRSIHVQSYTQQYNSCVLLNSLTASDAGNEKDGFGARWHFITDDNELTNLVQETLNNNIGTNNITDISDLSISTVSGNNLIVPGNTMANLVLTDGLAYYPPKAFTATSATYTRNAPNKWATICLPYAVSSNENVTYYTAGTINGDVLTLTSADEVPAGTPAICKFGSEGNNTINAANVNVVTGVQTESVTDDDITLIGSFTAKTIDATATTDNVYAISGGKFVHATKTLNLKPFRAYFTTSGSTSSNGFSIAVDDDSITAINALTGEGEVTIASIYSADGKQVNDLQPGLNIVKLSNGKVQKILVR